MSPVNQTVDEHFLTAYAGLGETRLLPLLFVTTEEFDICSLCGFITHSFPLQLTCFPDLSFLIF